MNLIPTKQILIPKQVYIGDHAELQCTFNSDLSYLRNAVLKSESITLDMNGFTRNIEIDKCEIKSVRFYSSGADYYTIVVSFIPWKTGRIELPEFDLGAAFGTEPLKDIIRFEPVSILTLLEGETSTGVKESLSPMLMPGTKYQIYGGAFALIVLTAVIIRLIIKRKEVVFFFKNRALMRKYNKNKKLAFKQLNKILDDSKMPSHDVAEEIQKVIRNYLEVRFDYPFTHTVTSELMNAFYKATLHILDEEKEDAFIGIATTFTRTDYIRYSKDASFKGGEKEELIGKLIRNITRLEAPEVDKSPDYYIEKGGSNA